MKNLILILCSILISCGSCRSKAAFDKIIFNENLMSHLFDSTEFTLNPLTLKTEYGYDNIPDSNLYAIRSNAIVNKDSLRLMRFAKLKRLNPNTLKLEIFETNPLYSQNMTIILVGNRFKMEFTYLTSGPPVNPKIKTTEQALSLKSIPKQKGEMMCGTFYYKGVCEADCIGDIEIKGNFRAELE